MYSMKFKVVFLSMIAAFALAACEKKTEEAPVAPVTPAEQAAPAPAAPEDAVEPVAEAEATETDATEAEATSSTGIPECDEFIEKALACYEAKVPENMRGALIDGVNQMKSLWAQAGEAEKAATAEACKQALENSKASLQAYGCEM